MKVLNKAELMSISGGQNDLPWWKEALQKVGEVLYDVVDYISTESTKSDYSNSQLFGPNGKTTI